MKCWQTHKLRDQIAPQRFLTFFNFQKILETSFIAYFMEPSVFLSELIYVQNFK